MSEKLLQDPKAQERAVRDWIVQEAEKAGPLAAEYSHRVVVSESDGRMRTRDFTNFNDAQRYADDVASEADYPPALAFVLDREFVIVSEGKLYGSR